MRTALICATVIAGLGMVIDFFANWLETADREGWDRASGALLLVWVIVGVVAVAREPKRDDE